MKYFFPVLFCLCLIACQKESPKPASTTVSPPTPQPKPSVQKPTEGLRVDSVVVSKKDKVAEIDIAYPVLKGLSDEKIQKTINDSLIVAAGSDITEPNGMDTPNAYDAGFNVTLLNPKVLSLTQTLYQFTGGAHGGTAILGRNFDLSNGKEWKLSDILVNEKSLFKIADFCRTELKKQHTFDEDWLNEGSDPKEPNNYNGFWFSKEGLHFNFGQYQIASYAEGMFEVKIPFEKLDGLVKPEILTAVQSN